MRILSFFLIFLDFFGGKSNWIGKNLLKQHSLSIVIKCDLDDLEQWFAHVFYPVKSGTAEITSLWFVRICSQLPFRFLAGCHPNISMRFMVLPSGFLFQMEKKKHSYPRSIDVFQI